MFSFSSDKSSTEQKLPAFSTDNDDAIPNLTIAEMQHIYADMGRRLTPENAQLLIDMECHIDHEKKPCEAIKPFLTFLVQKNLYGAGEKYKGNHQYILGKRQCFELLEEFKKENLKSAQLLIDILESFCKKNRDKIGILFKNLKTSQKRIFTLFVIDYFIHKIPHFKTFMSNSYYHYFWQTYFNNDAISNYIDEMNNTVFSEKKQYAGHKRTSSAAFFSKPSSLKKHKPDAKEISHEDIQFVKNLGYDDAFIARLKKLNFTSDNIAFLKKSKDQVEMLSCIAKADLDDLIQHTPTQIMTYASTHLPSEPIPFDDIEERLWAKTP